MPRKRIFGIAPEVMQAFGASHTKQGESGLCANGSDRERAEVERRKKILRDWHIKQGTLSKERAADYGH